MHISLFITYSLIFSIIDSNVIMQSTGKPLFSYSAFESFFRGKRIEIKDRFSAYLPIVDSLLLNNLGSVLDIGCGRGEWLELLAERGIKAKGIDCNHEFVDECHKLGLNSKEIDLFDFLPTLKDEQYNLITGFHLIEHIAPEKHSWFLETVFHLLAPGGVLILETPNPENVTVGSCNFYIDPTHRRPLPSQLLHFLALQAGFASPLIARLNRHTVGEPLRTMSGSEPGAAHYNQLAEIIASRLLQAPDYALIAFKPPSPAQAMLEAVETINRINDSWLLPPVTTEENEDIPLLRKRCVKLEQELKQIRKLLALREGKQEKIESTAKRTTATAAKTKPADAKSTGKRKKTKQ